MGGALDSGLDVLIEVSAGLLERLVRRRFGEDPWCVAGSFERTTAALPRYPPIATTTSSARSRQRRFAANWSPEMVRARERSTSQSTQS